MHIVSHVVFFAALLCSFVYGAVRSYKPGGVLFLQIVTSAAGTMMLGELYFLVELLIWRDIADGFNIGMLGTMGSFFFLLSASYGQIDGLGDDGSPSLFRYRLIPLILPVLLIILAAIDWRSNTDLSVRIVNLIQMIPLVIASYFHLKHLIIPDVENGILDALRIYNMICIAIDILGCLRIVLHGYDFDIASHVMTMLMAAAYLLLIPTADRGVKKWYT